MKSLLSLGLLGSALADSPCENSVCTLANQGNQVTIGSQLFGDTTIVEHSASQGKYDIEIRPMDNLDVNGQFSEKNAFDINVDLTWQAGIPTTSSELLVYHTKCEDVVDGTAVYATYPFHSEADVVNKKIFEKTDTSQPDTEYPVCLHLKNKDDGSTKHYGKLKALIAVKVDGGPATDEPMLEVNDNDIIYLEEDYKLTLSTIGGLSPVSAVTENNGITPGNFRTVGESSQIDLSYSKSFTVDNVKIQSTDYIKTGTAADLDATLKGDMTLTDYSDWKQGTADLSKKLKEHSASRSVASDVLTLTYNHDTNDNTFSVPYKHVKLSYIEYADDCGTACAGAVEITSSLIQTYAGAIVVDAVDDEPSGWDTSGHYNCTKIKVETTQKHDQEGSNPFDTSSEVALSALFDLADANEDCDLDDTLTFNTPTGATFTDCTLSAERLREKSYGSESTWFEDVYNTCKVQEPEAQGYAGETPAATTIVLKTTGASPATAASSDHVYYSAHRNAWTFKGAAVTTENQMGLSYADSESKFSKTQVDFTCQDLDTDTVGDQFNIVTFIGGTENGNAAIKAAIENTCRDPSADPLSLDDTHLDIDGSKEGGNDYGEKTCAPLTISVRQTIIQSDKFAETLSNGRTVTPATIELTASHNKPAELTDYTLTMLFDDSQTDSDDTELPTVTFQTAGTIHVDTESDIPAQTVQLSYADTTNRPETMTNDVVGNKQSAMTCGTPETKTFTTGALVLPCSDTTRVARSYDIYSRYSDQHAKKIDVTTSGMTVKETTEYYNTLNSGQNTILLSEALTFKSTAISADQAPALLTVGVTSSNSQSTYEAKDCSWSSDSGGIVCDLKVSGARTDIQTNGDNVVEDLDFDLEYNYANTDAQCAAGGSSSVKANAGAKSGKTMTFQTQNNKLGGRIYIRDIDNDKAEFFDETSAHVEDIVMSYAVPISDANNGVTTTPKISITLGAMSTATAGKQAGLTIFYKDTQLKLENGEDDCDDGECSFVESQTKASSTLILQVQQPYTASKSDGGQYGVNEAFQTIDIAVQLGSDDTTRREITLQVKVAPDDSVPFIKTPQGNDLEFVSQTAYSKEDIDGSVYWMYNGRYDSVHFDMRNKLLGTAQDLQLANETIIFEPANDQSCRHEGVVSTPGRTATLSEFANEQTFTTTDECISRGKVAFAYQGQCHVVEFDCKRHAGISDVHLNVNLDYGTTFTIGNGFKVDSIENGGVMTLGSTCSSDGKVREIESDALCTKDLTSTTDPVIFSGGLSGMLGSFQKCHDTFDDTTVDNTLVWEMSAVRQYTQGSQVFCHKKTLELSVLTEGEATATIAVQSIGAINFVFWTDKFYFGDAGDGCPGTERKLHLVIKGTSKVGVNPALKDFTTIGRIVENSDDTIDDSDLEFTVNNTDTGDILSLETQCQDFCKDEDRAINFDFVAKTTHNTQEFFADVSGLVSIGGNPCDNDHIVDHNELSATLKVAKPDSKSDTCDVSQVYTDGAGMSVLSDHALCYELTPSETAYNLNYLSSTVSKSSDGTSFDTPVPAALTDGNGATLVANTAYEYFKLGNIQPFADHTLKLTIHWKYNIGQSSRRLRSTYLLGSSDQESHASIQILPAGVQIQEQIEAAPAHDVVYNGTVLNTTDISLPDHGHSNADWGLGLSIGGVAGVVGLSVWIACGSGMRNKGYQQVSQVGRFQSNLAF